MHVFQVRVATGDGGAERLVRPGHQGLIRGYTERGWRRCWRWRGSNQENKRGWQNVEKKTGVPLRGMFGVWSQVPLLWRQANWNLCHQSDSNFFFFLKYYFATSLLKEDVPAPLSSEYSMRASFFKWQSLKKKKSLVKCHLAGVCPHREWRRCNADIKITELMQRNQAASIVWCQRQSQNGFQAEMELRENEGGRCHSFTVDVGNPTNCYSLSKYSTIRDHTLKQHHLSEPGNKITFNDARSHFWLLPEAWCLIKWWATIQDLNYYDFMDEEEEMKQVWLLLCLDQRLC